MCDAQILPLLRLLPSAIHIGQLGKLGSPVVEVVVVLAGIRTAGPQGAEAAGVAATALVREGNERVKGRGLGVILGVAQPVIQNITNVWFVIRDTCKNNFVVVVTSPTPVLFVCLFSLNKKQTMSALLPWSDFCN